MWYRDDSVVQDKAHNDILAWKRFCIYCEQNPLGAVDPSPTTPHHPIPIKGQWCDPTAGLWKLCHLFFFFFFFFFGGGGGLPVSWNILFLLLNSHINAENREIWLVMPFLYPRPTKWGIHFVRPSICPSVCRRLGFRSVTQVCFGISIPNFICMLFVGMDRSPLIFSDVTFKMAAWRPYWIFRFPDSNFSLPMNIKSKLQWHITSVYEKKFIDFQLGHF